MKFTRHKWGNFKRTFSHRTGRWSAWKLVSHHKTEITARSFRYRGEFVRRLTKAERNPQCRSR